MTTARLSFSRGDPGDEDDGRWGTPALPGAVDVEVTPHGDLALAGGLERLSRAVGDWLGGERTWTAEVPTLRLGRSTAALVRDVVGPAGPGQERWAAAGVLVPQEDGLAFYASSEQQEAWSAEAAATGLTLQEVAWVHLASGVDVRGPQGLVLTVRVSQGTGGGSDHG